MLRYLIFLASTFCILQSTLGATDVISCYVGTWANYRPGLGNFKIEDINPFLCTHLIYTFTGIDENGTVKLLDPWLDINLKALDRFTNLTKQNPKLKTILAVGGWNEGSAKYSNMVADPIKRSNFINSALQLTLEHGFNGFEADWEYPNQGGERGGVPADVKNFVELLKEMNKVFHKNNLIISVAVGATKDRGDTSYDVPGISKYVDLIHVMAYDLRTAVDEPKVVGHHAPLYASHIDTTPAQLQLNVDSCINYWLSMGADPQKLVLGVPFYARTFTLANPKNSLLGAPFTSGGKPGPYTQSTGTLGYNEICEILKEQSGWNVIWDDEQKVPHAVKGDQWIGYDNTKSLTIKAKYAKKLGLRGIMLWSMETDDFRGVCGPKYPLLNAINAVIKENSDDDNVPDSSTVTPNPDPSVNVTCTKSGFIRDPNDCKSYYYCMWLGTSFQPIKMPSCPEGLMFNEEKLVCDWPQNVKCQNT